MAKINPIQTRFSAGEISPRFAAQSDTEGYRAGLFECTNFVTTCQGPMYRRGGFEHIKEIPFNYAKVFPFQLDPGDTPGEAFPVVVHNGGKLMIFSGLVDTTGPELLDNSTFNDGIFSPWFLQISGGGSVVWDSGNARIQPTSVASESVGLAQEVTISAPDASSQFKIEVKTTDPLDGADLSKYSSTRYPPVKILVGLIPGNGELYDSGWVERLTELTAHFNPAGNTMFHVTIMAKGGDYSTVAPVPGVTPSDPVAQGIYGIQHRDIVSVISRKSSPAGDYVELLHSYDQNDIIEMTTYMHPSQKLMYILCSRVAPRQLRHDGTNWILENTAFTAMPASWVAGSYPTALTFSGGRAWWGGVRDKPNTVWGSKSGSANYTNITLGPNADDALEIEMTRRGRIRWLSGDKNLLIGTATTEYIITSDTGVIVPGDFQVDPQSANGSRATKPVSAGNSTLYVSSDGRKVFSADYKWTDQAWASRDLTFASEHITNDNQISAIALYKNPERIVWAATDSGRFLGCTYEPFTGQMGWHRHVTDGSVMNLCSLEKDGKSELYAIVLRDNESGGRSPRLERYDESLGLDACYRRSNITPTNTITGLDHLIGKTVGVLVDGATHPNKVVDATGSIVLQYSGNIVEVGLNYTAKAVTLPADWGTPIGSAAPMKKRWVRIGVRLIDSAYPLIDGNRPPTRLPSTPMGLRDPDITADAIVFGNGPNNSGQLTIEQDLPLPCMVAGIYGELDQNQL